jgi:hypothetical protein
LVLPFEDWQLSWGVGQPLEHSNWTEVRSQTANALYVISMATVIAMVDLLFFNNRFWERLTVNVGIVLVFTVFYFRFLKRP